MPPQPTPVVQRFADRDSVQPSFQGAAPPKSSNPLERLEKDVLRDIRSIERLGNDAYYKAIDRARIVGHQPVECRPGATLELRHELGFVLGPGEDARQVG